MGEEYRFEKEDMSEDCYGCSEVGGLSYIYFPFWCESLNEIRGLVSHSLTSAKISLYPVV